MKMFFKPLSLVVLGVCGSAAFAATDPCRGPALNAAEKEYGNEPDRTVVKTLTAGKKYRVTVGIGNPEDGAHDYYVEFPNGCDSTPTVTDVPFFPHPLRQATHDTYNALFRANDNKLPDSFKTPVSSVPAAARKQYNIWKRNCSSVGSYKITVAGKDTFTITTCGEIGGNIVGGISQYYMIFDASGKDIDEAMSYEENGVPNHNVGENGISWQNMEFEEQN